MGYNKILNELFIDAKVYDICNKHVINVEIFIYFHTFDM